MLVDSEGKQINPSLNQPTDPVFRFSSPKEYEAMRDFLLGCTLDWIKSKSGLFGVKELVGGPKGWEGTPLQWLYDHFEVKDVEAHQRYPWNGKVDIDFTIDSAVEGSNFAVRVEAKDTVGKTNITLKTVKYEDKVALSSLEKLPAGRHRVT